MNRTPCSNAVLALFRLFSLLTVVGLFEFGAGANEVVPRCESVFSGPKSFSVLDSRTAADELIAGKKNGGRNFTHVFIESLPVVDMSDGKWQGDQLTRVANSGQMNRGIFRRHKENGKSTIIKILFEYELSDITDQLVGSYLGEIVGAPEVLSYGRVKDSRNRMSATFIEMEELFPGEAFSTVKDSLRSPHLLQKNKAGHSMVEEFVDMIFEAAGEGIDAIDPDIAFNESGRIRWIDTQQFQKSAPTVCRYQALHAIAEMIEGLSNQPALADEFLVSLARVIKTRADLAPELKSALLNNFIRSFHRKVVIRNILITRKLLDGNDVNEKSVTKAINDLYTAL